MMFQLLVLIITNLLPFHQFHSSITTLEYDKKGEVYEIVIRVFTDDLEKAIRQQMNKKLDLEQAEGEAALKIYLSKHFSVKAPKSRNTNWEWVGYVVGVETTDLLVMYKARLNQSLLIENNILMEVFDDQQNIVNRVYGKQTHSHLYSPGNGGYLFPAVAP